MSLCSLKKIKKSAVASNAGVYEQEAQLSQKDRATLRVTEYFTKSLKITQGHSK